MQRRPRGPLNRFAAIATSTCVSVALVSGIGGPATEWSARAATLAVLPVAAIEESPSTIGIAEGDDFYLMSEADIERTLDAMQALGVQNVRIGIFWADIESEEGVYKWANVDRMVDAATARGMGILGTILYTPRWAGATQPPEDTEWASHPDPVKFGNFVTAVAEEYEGRISSYEIWNEPTTTIFWSPADPAAYTEILKQGYAAIKAVDPSAVVIAGSAVAGPTYQDGSSLSPVDFLEGMYDAGAHGYFDAISYHPYLYTMPFSDGAHQVDQFDYPIEQLDQMRALMVEHGDGDIKVWITEYGQPAGTVYQNVALTQEQQAAFIEDLLRTWQSVDGAGPVFVYQTRDTEADGTDPDAHFGLYDFAWNPKLAAGVLADLIEEFTPLTSPVNPLQALVQRIVHAVGQVLSFVPRLITQVVRAVVNFAGSILGVGQAPRGASLGPSTAASPQPEVAETVSPSDGERMAALARSTSRSDKGDDAERVQHADALDSPEPLMQSGPGPQPPDQVEVMDSDERPTADAETPPGVAPESDAEIGSSATENADDDNNDEASKPGVRGVGGVRSVRGVATARSTR